METLRVPIEVFVDDTDEIWCTLGVIQDVGVVVVDCLTGITFTLTDVVLFCNLLLAE